MAVRKIERRSILDKYFALHEQSVNKSDKYFQQFILRLREPDVRQHIDALRKSKRLNPETVNKAIEQFRSIVRANDRLYRQAKKLLSDSGTKPIRTSPEFCKMLNKVGYTKRNKKAEELFIKLQKYVDSKITISDIRNIIKTFKLPYSWEYPLCYYLITDNLIDPFVRCWAYSDNEKVILEISAEATDDDLKDAFKRVEALQKFLPGYELKNIRIRKKLDEKLAITKDYKKYVASTKKSIVKNYDEKAENIGKAEDRLKLVDKYNQKAISAKKQKREEGRQRQIYKRYKKYA